MPSKLNLPFSKSTHSPVAVLRPLAARLSTLYESLPAGALRNAARRARRDAGREYRKSVGIGHQQVLLPSAQGIPAQAAKAKAKVTAQDIRQALAARIKDGREIDVVERIAHAVEVAGRNSLAWHDADIRDMAKSLADKAGGYIGRSDREVVRIARDWIKAAFEIPGRTPADQRKRLKDPRFWRRVLRKTVWRAAERAHLVAGLVGKRGMQQISDFSLKIKEGMLKGQREWLEASTVESVNDDGEIISLSLANLADEKEKQRQAEFWCWCAAFQLLAEQSGLEMSMLTLTLEPEYHPNPSNGGGKWNGTTPAEAHKELVRRWAVIRAALAQLSITLSGFRVVEAHKDGCPHFHVLIAYRPAVRATILAEVLKRFPGKIAVRTRDTVTCKDTRMYFDDAASAAGAGRSETYKNEGAQAELTIINIAISRLVTYMTKYLIKLSKNDRAGAWRSCWSIRGIQWFGVRDSFTGWRELRRLKEFTGSGVGRALWNRARDNDVAGFLELLGGLAAAPVPAAARIEGAYRGAQNGYGELVKKLRGVWIFDLQSQQAETITTRLKTWILKTVFPKKDNENKCITVNQSYPSKTKSKTKKPKKPNSVRKKLGGGLLSLTVKAVT